MRTLTELRISNAYVKFLGTPEGGRIASVSLVRIANCEIRMFREPGFSNRALFWLELFDHDTKTSVDGFRCDKIEDAAPVFDDLMLQAAYLSNPGTSGAPKH